MRLENRHNQRFQWFVNAYPKGDTNNNLSIGIVTNISITGLNLWLDCSKAKVSKKFAINLQPPNELNMESLNMDLEKVWDKFYQELDSQQIGCQFVNMTTAQMKSLVQIINFLKLTDTELLEKSTIAS